MVNPFSIPNVPTDNLYKFYALSGIFIIIFSIVFSIYFGYKIVDELILLHNSNSMVALEIDFLNSDVEFILNKTKQLENDVSNFYSKPDSLKNESKILSESIKKAKTDQNWRNYLEFYFKNKNHIIPGLAILIEIDSLETKIKTNLREIQKKHLSNELKLRELKIKIIELIIVLVIGISLIKSGFKLSNKGFKLWKTNVQDLIDQKLKIELRLLNSKKFYDDKMDNSNEIDNG